MPWSRELNRLNPMDWPKILYDLFGTRFPIASQIAVTLLGAALFGGAWWVLARHARLSPSLNPSQTASAPIGQAAGVAHVVGDRGRSGHRAAARELSRDEHLRAVPEGEHRLLDRVEFQ